MTTLRQELEFCPVDAAVIRLPVCRRDKSILLAPYNQGRDVDAADIPCQSGIVGELPGETGQRLLGTQQWTMYNGNRL